jgi:hypothetical protein
MKTIGVVFVAFALSAGAAFAQTPGIGETRPTPPSLDEQRGPVGGGTGKEAAPVGAPEKPRSASDQEISRCDKLSDATRDECLRHERSAAGGGTRRAEPATSTPPQNPR